MPAAEASASAERKRERLPASAMSSAVSTTPMPGRLRMRAASGWRSSSASSSRSSLDQAGAAGQRLAASSRIRRAVMRSAGTAMVCSAAAASARSARASTLGSSAGGLQVAHQTLLAGGAQLGRGDVARQQVQRSFGLEVEAGFQSRERCRRAGRACATAAGSAHRPDRGAGRPAAGSRGRVSVAGSIGRRSERVRTWSAMVRASRGSDLFSPPTVPWRARLTARPGTWTSVKPASASMASARPAMPPMTSRPMRTCRQGGELVGEACDVGRRVQQLAVDLHDAVGVDGGDPVYLLGDVDPDADPHGAPWRLKVRHPARAVFALHSDESQSLISGRGGVAVSGDLPPEPSGQPA